tara:strand:+ start:7547 stop:7702 length:156 start_codon:yes stop_codon:yes gene_type:complete
MCHPWINKSDVIHRDKTIDFFTKVFERNPISTDYYIRGFCGMTMEILQIYQ